MPDPDGWTLYCFTCLTCGEGFSSRYEPAVDLVSAAHKCQPQVIAALEDS